MTWKILLIVLFWLTLSVFWMAGLFVYKNPQLKIRDKNWVVFLISTLLFILAAEYLTADYLLKSFVLPQPFNYLADMIGIVLLSSGLGFAIWARMTLGRFWSGSVAFIEDQPIITKGPYAFVRHPIYAGVIAMLWGSFFIGSLGILFLMASIGTIALYAKAKFEETMLVQYKGEEYIRYKKRVKDMI